MSGIIKLSSNMQSSTDQPQVANTSTYGNFSFGEGSPPAAFPAELFLIISGTIFTLAVTGNLLVILTLIRNKRMRTVTNVFLLNLAISDLLLAVFCMPFTLIPLFMKNFVFGPYMCVFIRYAQGVSVGASCFTLVAISLERYFAICRPLHSRRWQTLSHAYKTICGCWALSMVIVIPIGVATTHVEIRPGFCRCLEIWTSLTLEKIYTVFLDMFLMLVPLILMTGAYIKIICTLFSGITIQSNMSSRASRNGSTGDESKKQAVSEMIALNHTHVRTYAVKTLSSSSKSSIRSDRSDRNYYTDSASSQTNSPVGRLLRNSRQKAEQTRLLKHDDLAKNRKYRVIRMLLVLVIEFFVCWSPLYILQTWRSFHEKSFVTGVSTYAWSTMFCLSYFSSCCNPITYCFMNRRFRESFISALRCSSMGAGRSRMSLYASSKRTSNRRFTWIERVDDSSPISSERGS